LFGIANQMLAGIALIVACVVLIKMGKKRHAWVALLPTAWLMAVTLCAGWQKLFDDNPQIGFLAHARKFTEAIDAGVVLMPASSFAEMRRVVFNDYIDATLTALFVAVVLAMLVSGIAVAQRVWRVRWSSARETPAVFREEKSGV
jgi:carbon starvation protein